jgi:hypothetical protein
MHGNNPGNLRRWGAMPVVNGFAVFPNITVGLEAMEAQLGLYFQRGLNTLQKIIRTWAPASDNNPTNNYILNVSRMSGFDENQVLDWTHPLTKGRIMFAMIHQEQGGVPVPLDLLRSVAGMVMSDTFTGPLPSFETPLQPATSPAAATAQPQAGVALPAQENSGSGDVVASMVEAAATDETVTHSQG